MSKRRRKTLDDLAREAEARPAIEVTPMLAWHDRIEQHLAWCLSNAILSFDKCRELLGVRTETMRETVRFWADRGWYTDQHAKTGCVVCGGPFKDKGL